MSGGGGTKTETVTQTSEPWDVQKQYLQKGFQRAEDWVLNQPTQYYPGQTYVGFDPYTQQAMSGIAERAGGSPLVGAGQEQLEATLRGDYLAEGNPYLDAVAENVAGSVMPQVQSAFGTAGRSGFSPLAQATASDAMTKALAPYEYGAYADERARQMQAAGMAPQLAGEDYRDLQALASVGQMQEAKDMEALQDQMNRFYFGQDEPRNRLEQFMRLVSGGYGGTTVGDQIVPTSNPLMQGLGAVIGGAGALGGLGWRPFA